MSQQITDLVQVEAHQDPARHMAPSAPSGAGRFPHRPRPAVLFVAILTMLGVILLLLPTIAAWFSQALYSAEIRDLNQITRVVSPEYLSQSLDAAREYNKGLPGSALVAANERLPQATGPEGQATSVYNDPEYKSLLSADPTGLMARLKIPAIDADLPIYHGTDDATLLKGVGHLQGTALPVGGPSTHSVLTAHRGLASAELFTRLDELEIGDTFTIEVFGQVLSYKVFSTVVVAPDETRSLFPQQGRDLVTLITCTPLGINSHRILVTAERIDPTPVRDLDAANDSPDIPGVPWWAFALLGTAAAIGWYIHSDSRRQRGKST